MTTLGMKYCDKITGFEGTATGRAEYLTGCVQVLLVPTVDEKGLIREGHWFDEDRLEALDVPAVEVAVTNPGGPQMFTPPVR